MAVGGEVHAAGEFRFERVDEGFAVCVITGPAYVGALLQTEREQAIAKRGAHVLPGFNWSSQHPMNVVPRAVPSALPPDERVRDVVRCRETFQREILKSRHYILKFLAMRGFVFREGTNWYTPHPRWLQHLTTDGSPLACEDRLVYRECHALLMYKLQRREQLDRQIEELAELLTLKPIVQTLQCFRGISLHSAMALATELIDWRRFERPGQLAYYLGLVSREDSSGNRQRLGSITKAGNSHCRHVLVQAAWSYRHRPQTSVDLKRRQAGQPPAVITHAWKAQQRLHARFNHLSYRKRPQIAVVSVARELVGFLWAVARQVDPNTAL